ncbi:MAG: hypothetical protein ACRC3B_06530, partial [Bacteroidia bacterium]
MNYGLRILPLWLLLPGFFEITHPADGHTPLPSGKAIHIPVAAHCNAIKNVLTTCSRKKQKEACSPQNIVAIRATNIDKFQLGSDNEFGLSVTIDYACNNKIYQQSTHTAKNKDRIKADELDITINGGQLLPDMRVKVNRDLEGITSKGLEVIVRHKQNLTVRDTLIFELNTLEVRYEFAGKDGKDGRCALFGGRDARAADEGCDCAKGSRSGNSGYDGEDGENGAKLSVFLKIKHNAALGKEMLYVAIKNHTTNYSEVHIVHTYCKIVVSTAAGSGGTGGNGSRGGDGLMVNTTNCRFSCDPSDGGRGGDGGDAGMAGQITVYVDSSVTLADLNFTAEIKTALPGGGGMGGSGG